MKNLINLKTQFGQALSREELKKITGGFLNGCELLCCGEIHDCRISEFPVESSLCVVDPTCDIDYEVNEEYCQFGILTPARCRPNA